MEPDWASSRPPTRPPTPSTRPHSPRTRPSTPSTRPQSPHSVQSGHELKSHYPVVSGGVGRPLSPVPAPLSRALARPSSPLSHSMPPSPQSNARTPPPKRWKRNFDLARTEGETEEAQAVHKIHLQDAGPEFGESVAKRFCEKRYLETEREKRLPEDVNSRFVEPSQQQPVMASYPHSMPASPTMFDARYSQDQSKVQTFNLALQPKYDNNRKLVLKLKQY